jgi:hypothetical protein
MKRAGHRGMRSAWAMLVWAAMLMFAVQPLAAQAMAATDPGPTVTLLVCSDHGGGKVVVDLNGVPVDQKAECGKCPSCLGAPVAAEPVAPLSAPARYSYQPAVFTAGHDLVVAGARAPPRPPSQGPPASHA